MKLKQWLTFEPGEKEKFLKLMEENQDKSTSEKVELVRTTFGVSYGVAQIAVDKYPTLNK